MKNAQNGTAGRTRTETDERTEPPLIVSILQETGLHDFCSMAWLLERFDQQEKPI